MPKRNPKKIRKCLLTDVLCLNDIAFLLQKSRQTVKVYHDKGQLKSYTIFDVILFYRDFKKVKR